jgi:hypothetical protein
MIRRKIKNSDQGAVKIRTTNTNATTTITTNDIVIIIIIMDSQRFSCFSKSTGR